MYEWSIGNAYAQIVTLYPNNFTLNTTAASYFKDIRYCCIGIDSQALTVAIKPVTKREIDLNLVPSERLHKVSMGKGYCRISNKQILDEISRMLNISCNGNKFSARFDEDEQMLIIDLNKPL